MKNLFIFLAGAAIGSITTWKVIEKKYKDIADEEIESVKQVFKERQEKLSNIGSNVNNFETYKDIIKDLSYENRDCTLEDTEEKKEESNDISLKKDDIDRSKPYVISPEEYGEIFGYETKSWTYYADDILVDEFDQIVEDPELYIGDGLKHFGEFEDDSVFVRDEKASIDYEILRVTEEFSKIF